MVGLGPLVTATRSAFLLHSSSKALKCALTPKLALRPAGVISIIHGRRTFASKTRLHVGDKLPDVKLFEGSPANAVPASELYKGKKGVLFAVVGAFTPGCTNSHIPEFLDLHDKFHEEGYVMSCVAVNDPFVMGAWGKSTGAEGKIRMLADPQAEFTKALGMDIDCTKLLGGVRSHKYSLVIEDGIVRSINVDPEHTGLACLLCIQQMKAETKPSSRLPFTNR